MIVCTMIVDETDATLVQRALDSAFAAGATGAHICYSEGSEALLDKLTPRTGVSISQQDKSLEGDLGALRTQAMRDAERRHGMGSEDFHLILDADDVIDGTINQEALRSTDCAEMLVVNGEIRYPRPHLLRAGVWEYRCPVHEYAAASTRPRISKVPLSLAVYKVVGGGKRTTYPEKYMRDVRVISEWMDKHNDPNSPDWPRMQFYLAQSLHDAGRLVSARQSYIRRFNNKDGFDEERYISALRVARMEEDHERESWLLRANEVCPNRHEAVTDLAQYYNKRNKHQAALGWLKERRRGEGRLFVEPTFRFWEEMLVAAYHADEGSDWFRAHEVLATLLSSGAIPEDHKERVEENLVYRRLNALDDAVRDLEARTTQTPPAEK